MNYFDDYKEEPWVEKCRKCTHVYYRKNDADTMRCRCRKGCNFKEYKPKKSVNNLKFTDEKMLKIIKKAIKRISNSNNKRSE